MVKVLEGQVCSSEIWLDKGVLSKFTEINVFAGHVCSSEIWLDKGLLSKFTMIKVNLIAFLLFGIFISFVYARETLLTLSS